MTTSHILNGCVQMTDPTDRSRRGDSKVTSMIELFSGGDSNSNLAEKTVAKRVALNIESCNRDGVSESHRRTHEGTPNYVIVKPPLKRRTSPVLLKNSIPKPYNCSFDEVNDYLNKKPHQRTELTATDNANGSEKSVEKPPTRLNDFFEADAFSFDGRLALVEGNTERPAFRPKKNNIVQARLSELQSASKENSPDFNHKNGSSPKTSPMSFRKFESNSTRNSSSVTAVNGDETKVQASEDDTDGKKIKDARNYWELKSRARPHTTKKLTACKSDSNLPQRREASTRNDLSSMNRNESEGFRRPFTSESGNLVADRVRNLQNSDALGSPLGSTVGLSEKPAFPSRPRFMTSAARPNQVPNNLSVSVHGSKSVFRSNHSPVLPHRSLSPLALYPTPGPKSSQRPNAQNLSNTSDKNLVNPVPKPARTFTFTAADTLQRPQVNVARVSSNPPSGYNSLSSDVSKSTVEPKPRSILVSTSSTASSGYNTLTPSANLDLFSQSVKQKRTSASSDSSTGYNTLTMSPDGDMWTTSPDNGAFYESSMHSIKQKPKKKLTSTTSDATSGYNRLASPSMWDKRKIDSETRAPKEGYEEVTFFGHKANRSQTMNPSHQKWERQHNYEEVETGDQDDISLSSREDYDRINFPTSPDLQNVNDRYSHLTFKQDLHSTQGKPSPVKTSPKNQHMRLCKHNSDTTAMMSRNIDDLSRSEKTVESGLLLITDRIRDAFSQVGKKYHHHYPKNANDSDSKSTSSSGDEDSDTETDFSKHRQTLDRVRTYQRTYRKTLKYKSLERELSKSDESSIFEQVLICKVIADQGDKISSKVSYRYPAPPPGKAVGDETTLAHFCFPDINAIEPVEKMQSQSYSFMLTREDGTRKFGYCRRILPPGIGPRYPVVYCLISPLGSFGLYELLLDALEQKHRTGLKSVATFLETIFNERFPAPGRTLIIKVKDLEGPYTFVLRRPLDTRLEHVNLQCLIEEMGVDNTIKVFASLLLERRVIISGKSLSILTACIHALQSLLYPFVWQHVFVPVLPPHMIDLCCSPTPLLVGILDTSLERLKTLPLEEVFIVNLSTREVISSQGDELELLPRKLQSPLMNTLARFIEDKDEDTSQPSYDFAIDFVSAKRNTVISESFMHLFVEMIGHYQDHLQNVMQPTNSPATRFGKVHRNFNRDSFYEDVTSRSLRRFLDMFMGTQMFDGFIHSRELASPDYEGLFEQRISYHLRNSDASQLNFKVIKSKMKKLMFGIGKKR